MAAVNPEVRLEQPYQVMLPLTPTEYEALREDIRVRGVLVPVELDERGHVLDGHHRLRVCEDLGITRYPRVIRAGLSEAEKVAHALALNLTRRHLDPVARATHVSALRAQGWSTRRIAQQTGISQSTVVRDLRAEPGDSTAQDVVIGADGKRYKAQGRPGRPSVYAQSPREQVRAQSALAALGGEAPNKVLGLQRAERLVREVAARSRRAAASTDAPGMASIEQRDFRDLDVEPGTVSLVFTDPPYRAADFRSGLWEDLAKRAAVWLRPGGLLIAYTGQQHLPRALSALEGHLEYWWTFAVTHGGTGAAQVRQRAIASAWKPLVVFRAPGGSELPPFTVDLLRGGGRQKDTAHPWQQGVEEAAQCISSLTVPGDLVVDPFVGSGTTAVAAVRLGRRIIGCDLVDSYVETARQRV